MDKYRIESTIKSLSTGYVVALLFIAAIASMTHVIAFRVIESQSTNSSVVNVSGRQRMLSQRIAMLAEHYVTHGTENDRSQLSAATSLFERSHKNLVDSIISGGELPESVSEIYFSEPMMLDSLVTRYVETARKIISDPHTAPEEVEVLVSMARWLAKRIDIHSNAPSL
jgi:hypothetical protein